MPHTFLSEGLKYKKSKIFGHELTSLSREELIAVAGLGWHNYYDLQKRVADEKKFVNEQFSRLDKQAREYELAAEKLFEKAFSKHDDIRKKYH